MLQVTYISNTTSDIYIHDNTHIKTLFVSNEEQLQKFCKINGIYLVLLQNRNRGCTFSSAFTLHTKNNSIIEKVLQIDESASSQTDEKIHGTADFMGKLFNIFYGIANLHI